MENDKKSIGIGVIGCGAAVENLYAKHLEAFEHRGWARVLGVADPQADRRSRISKLFRDAKGFASHDEMLEQEKIDLAIVASPPALHLPHVLSALEHGCNIFCEKPMVPTTNEGERLLVAMRDNPLKLAVGMPRRFFPNFVEVSRWIAEGMFGDEIAFTIREGGAMKWPAVSDSLFSRKRAGGGVLLDKGSHLIDQLLMLFGSPLVVSCEDDSSADGVEANVLMKIAFPHASGIMQASWEFPLRNGLRMEGNGVEVTLGMEDIGSYRLRQRGGPWKEIAAVHSWPTEPRAVGPRRLQPKDYDECFWLQLVAMLRSIQLGEPVPVGLDAGLAVTRCIENGYKISRPLEFPWLERDEREAFSKNHWQSRQ